jgi:hypothetical protein
MSGAGVAHLGNAGNVILNPAGLGFITNTERYHTLLAVASFTSSDGSNIDDGVSFIPAFVAKNFNFQGGVIQPYFSSSDFTVSTEKNVGFSESFTGAEVKSFQLGFGWGKNWNGLAFGLTTYVQSSTLNFTYFEDNKTPGESFISNYRGNSKSYTLGAALGLAQQLTGWSRGTYYDIASDTHLSLDNNSNRSDLRIPYTRAGVKLDLSSDLHLLSDIGYLFPAKGNDNSERVDYSGAPDFRMGLIKDFENDRNIYLGARFEAKNNDRESNSPEQADYGFSGGFKHRIKTSQAFYGLSYRQSESGDSRTYALVFGSDFAL